MTWMCPLKIGPFTTQRAALSVSLALPSLQSLRHAAVATATLLPPPPRCRYLCGAGATSAVLTRRRPAAHCCRRCRAIPAALLPRCRCHPAATTGAAPPPPPPCYQRRRAISAAALSPPLPLFLSLSLLSPPPRYCAATAGCRRCAIAAAALPAAQPPRCPPLPRCHYRCRAIAAPLPPPQ
jgi:hypothetical protein